MNRLIFAAVLGMTALAATSPATMAEAASDMPMKFMWTGNWVWANGRPKTPASYEWLKFPSARYCYNNTCRMVSHTYKGTTDTFSLDGAFFEFKSLKGGLEMSARYWIGGFRQHAANAPPDATATFHSKTPKSAPAAPPAKSGNLKWMGPWSWARPLTIFGKPVDTKGQRISIELLPNDRVNLCVDLRRPTDCKVVPFTTKNEAYVITAAGGYYEVRLNENNLFGMFWFDPNKRAQTTPDGTFDARQVK